jgi:hypothetical protein
MLRLDRKKVAGNKLPIGLLLAELVMALLTVYLFYRLLGLELDFEERGISIAPAADPMILFFFVLSAAVLVAVYLAAKKKTPGLLQAQQLAPGTIGEKTREKLALAGQDPRAAALLLVQFMFVFAVVLTIVAWLDPWLELIPWSRIGINAPLTTALNAIIAVIGLGFFYYLYSFTAWYRK